MEPDIQHLSLDLRRFLSSFVVRPRDLTWLLSNFQTSLQEITIIATEPSAPPSDAAGEIWGKLRSYIGPTKGFTLGTLNVIFIKEFHVFKAVKVTLVFLFADNSDLALHTQLWIDRAEEFLHFTHLGDPVDVTFGVKELKVILICLKSENAW